MSVRDQHIKEAVRILQSGKEIAIIEAVRGMYDTGTVEILPHLFRLFFVTRSELIRKEILGLLNNIKDKNACPYFMEAVRNYKGQEFYHQIVSSCWQNGLDFSGEIQVFIDLVIEQDLFTAVEAFSVVEENISAIGSRKREAFVRYIRSKFTRLDEERIKLLRELTHVVSNIPGPFTPGMN
jgi:hypothetical protein